MKSFLVVFNRPLFRICIAASIVILSVGTWCYLYQAKVDSDREEQHRLHKPKFVITAASGQLARLITTYISHKNSDVIPDFDSDSPPTWFSQQWFLSGDPLDIKQSKKQWAAYFSSREIRYTMNPVLVGKHLSEVEKKPENRERPFLFIHGSPTKDFKAVNFLGEPVAN